MEVSSTFTVIVVHPESLGPAELEAFSMNIKGVPSEQTAYMYLTINEGNAGSIEAEIEELVDNDESIICIYIWLDGDDGIVTEWFEETSLGFWRSLYVPYFTNDNFYANWSAPSSDRSAIVVKHDPGKNTVYKIAVIHNAALTDKKVMDMKVDFIIDETVATVFIEKLVTDESINDLRDALSELVSNDPAIGLVFIFLDEELLGPWYEQMETAYWMNLDVHVITSGGFSTYWIPSEVVDEAESASSSAE